MSGTYTGSKPYTQIGVYLPVESEADTRRVVREWPIIKHRLPPDQQDADFNPESETHLAQDGFLLVANIAPGNDSGKATINIVQSRSTGELFINKLMQWPPPDCDEGTYTEVPWELRVSTYGGNWTIDGADDDDSQRPDDASDWEHGILPDNVDYLNKLRFWQCLKPDDAARDEDHVFSFYLEYCNGGSLEQLIQKYNELGKAVPEHFIWHVAEKLLSAIATFQLGWQPRQHPDGTIENYEPANWKCVYHRDLVKNNVFIHFRSRGPGIRSGVREEDAFPDIVVGDFGLAGVEDDDPHQLMPNLTAVPDGQEDDEEAKYFLEPWEDLYWAGCILREMSMTHVPQGGLFDDRPDDRFVADTNSALGALPYSTELINLLQRFEWDGQEHGGSIRNLDDPAAQFPTAREIVDTLLPRIRRRVEEYRKQKGKRPRGYFDSMDMSWLKRQALMPFSYNLRYAVDAGDRPNGRPQPEEDGDEDEDEEQDQEGGQDEDEDIDIEEPAEGEYEEEDDSIEDSDEPEEPEGSEEPEEPEDEEMEDLPDEDMAAPVRAEVNEEQQRMRNLGSLHIWNNARPRYQLCSLSWGVPNFRTLHDQPPN